jgi:hypothetical protein
MTYITQIEAARRLGVSQQQIAKYVADGRIKSELIAGRRCIVARGLRKPRPKKPGRKAQKS